MDYYHETRNSVPIMRSVLIPLGMLYLVQWLLNINSGYTGAKSFGDFFGNFEYAALGIPHTHTL